MRKNLPDAENFVGRAVPGSDGYVVERLVGSGNNAHVFLVRNAELQREAACKVIPRANLVGADEDPPGWWDEIQKANSLNSSRVVKFFLKGAWGPEFDNCVFVMSDYVNGVSLRKYIQEHKRDLDLDFVWDFLREMLDFLRELKEVDLRHGDLHSGNVLVEDRSSALVGSPYAFRVTDFGVSPATIGTLRDDFEQLAITLREMLESIDYRELQEPRDRFRYNFLKDEFLPKKLLESDSTHEPTSRDPVLLFGALDDARRSFAQRAQAQSRQRLTTPFDYASCEQFGDSPELLKALYSDRFLALPAIQARNNLVLTGPRGCGKSTVFRSLSLHDRSATDDDNPADVDFIGLYYRCDDLYFSFPRYKHPERDGALDVPLHFLTSSLGSGLLRSVRDWLERHFSKDLARDESRVASDLWSLLDIPIPNHPSAMTLEAVAKALDKQRARAAKKQRFVTDLSHPMGRLFGPEVLPGICSTLVGGLPALSGRPVFFLIDDYSSPKITADLQRNLNRLAMLRADSCFFKLATESPVSYENSDVDGKVYVEGREFELANIGTEFINADLGDKLAFIDDVFRRRLESVGDFPVQTLVSLVGDDADDPGFNEAARRIREKKHPIVWGRKAVGELCSGDIHFVIKLVAAMVESAGGADALHRGATPAIDPAIQNKAVREEAGKFLMNLRALPDGDALVDIVEAFGNVAGSYLRFRDSKNEAGSPPHQATRIEPLEEPHLKGQTREVYDRLLRYGVFVEDFRGKSRRGHVVRRLYLRRFLIPHFVLTFSRRDSIELDPRDLVLLLDHPKRFENKFRLKGPQGSDPNQLELE